MMRPTIFRFRAGGRGGDTGYRLGLQVSLELRFWRLIFVARGARLALKSEQSACGVAELARTRDWLVRSHDPEKWDRFSEKIMLKQRDEIMIRFNLIGS